MNNPTFGSLRNYFTVPPMTQTKEEKKKHQEIVTIQAKEKEKPTFPNGAQVSLNLT